MTDPKKLAEEYLNKVKIAPDLNCIPGNKYIGANGERITFQSLIEYGYNARDTEIAELKARLEAAVRVIINCQEIAFAPNVNYSPREDALQSIEEEMKK